MRKLTYFVACSLDGFIGDPAGDANSFMSLVSGDFLEFLTTEYPDTISQEGRRILGIADAPNKRFDAVVQGRGSYQLGLDAGMPSPYGHLREFVASRSIEKSPHPNVEIIAEDLVGRIRALKAEDSAYDIWLCGGSEIAGQLADEVDELVIKTYPQVYGSGMPMFGSGFAIHDYGLDAVRAFDNGVVVRWYSRKR
ncbi:dihydrofolate reductase family protein [Streptomyces sp. NPDC015131]|uniref:dihydrofolate reductase family protein n=1 Tax=Streptomyces sp. NPDC015131 TaxID=3364941 RepID=UPI0036F797BB